MWCPSVSLALWGNAWLAGRAAPDDVLDALSLWAPHHRVTAYDLGAANRTGLPWPDVDDAGVVSILQVLRMAAGPRTSRPALSLVLPVPGDVRGLPPGSAFAADALAVGEAVRIESEDGAIGLVPEYGETEDAYGDEPEPDGSLSWTVYSLPSGPVAEQFDLGAAELELRSAVRTAAEQLTALRAGGPGANVEDPRELVEQLLAADREHAAPDHAPDRALRVLDTAAQVDAILTVSEGMTPISIQSSSGVQLAGAALQPLSLVVRTARLAAVDAILRSAWQV